MMKKKLPEESTYFIVYRKEDLPVMIENLIEEYELPETEIHWLQDVKNTLFCNTLFWQPSKDMFGYLHASGGFLVYSWLSHNQPETIVFDKEQGFEEVYTDKINLGVFFQVED